VVGMRYWQEFYAGEAEDVAEIIELGAAAQVPSGTYQDVLITEDWTPLEPDVRETKFYAPGVGLIRERQTAGGSEAFELVAFEGP
jgi:hypothetical protein